MLLKHLPGLEFKACEVGGRCAVSDVRGMQCLSTLIPDGIVTLD